MTIDNYMTEAVRQQRSLDVAPLTEQDVIVYEKAGRDFDIMKDALKTEYQFYCVRQAQKARYMTKNKGW